MKNFLLSIAILSATAGCVTAQKIDNQIKNECSSALSPSIDKYATLKEINDDAQRFRCSISGNESVADGVKNAYSEYASAYNRIIDRQADLVANGSEGDVTMQFCKGLEIQKIDVENNFATLKSVANPQSSGSAWALLFGILDLVIEKSPELIEAYTSSNDAERLTFANAMRETKISNTNWNSDGCP